MLPDRVVLVQTEATVFCSICLLLGNRSCFGRLMLLSDDSVMCLVPSGASTITVCRPWESGSCGLVPLGEPVETVTTAGLKWNLAGARLEFGGLVRRRACEWRHVNHACVFA